MALRSKNALYKEKKAGRDKKEKWDCGKRSNQANR